MVPAFVRSTVVACSILIVPTLAPAQAQRVAIDRSPQPPGQDSARVLSRARTAQASFERFRFQRLPRSWGGAPNGRCDETIGRFCFWFSDDEQGDQPPPEPPAIAERRRALLDSFGQAAATLPGDGWIAGQRVRYLLEAGDDDGAVAAARACRAERWWCAALEGLALHEAQRFQQAEQAFDTALAAMPADERERWMDVEVLLRPADKRTWRDTPGPDRAWLARRMWWLSDPLWSEPGNDRLTEHYARWTMDRIQQRSRQLDRLRWDQDLTEILLRYGWFSAWERYEPMFYGGSESASAIGYNEPRTWEFLPPLPTVRDPTLLRGDEWPLREPEPTITRYAPEYARHIMMLPHQLAVFPRRDAALLVAGYAVPEDSLPRDPRLRAALVAMDEAGGRRSESPWQPTAASGALYVQVPAPNTVVSLELREDSTRAVARHRQAVAWKSDAPVSDLLLLAHPDARPVEVMEAARIARGSAILAPGERVGVFWEMYDVERSDSVQVRVGLVPARAVWGRRRLEAIGIAKGARTVRMGWSEGVEAGPVIGRSLAVGIPADLRPGEYSLEVTVTAPGRPPATARRPITVRR
jgi:tetratricopeptide (TPR) repeat protein